MQRTLVRPETVALITATLALLTTALTLGFMVFGL